jgi:hypothetical protein
MFGDWAFRFLGSMGMYMYRDEGRIRRDRGLCRGFFHKGTSLMLLSSYCVLLTQIEASTTSCGSSCHVDVCSSYYDPQTNRYELL